MRKLVLLCLAVIVVGFAGLAGGCLSTGDECGLFYDCSSAAGGAGGQTGTGGTVGKPCMDDVMCDDQSLCTDDKCGADGKCANTPNNKIPDDKIECTKDTCDGTAEKHEPVGDGEPCGTGGALKCEGKTCKGCMTDKQCGDSNTCVTFKCNTQTEMCGVTKAPAETVVDYAGIQDCKKHVCDGNGTIIDAADETDAPTGDGNLCRRYGCDGMTPINGEPEPVTKQCGLPSCTEDPPQEQPQSFCDGDGSCSVQSVKPCELYYRCKNGACQTVCANDTDCTTAGYCLSQACVSKLSQGMPCTGSNQCWSGYCVDGVCCGSACAGDCQSCSFGEPGTCTNVPTGVQEAPCTGNQRCTPNQLCKDLGANEAPIGALCGGASPTITCDGQDNTCSDGFCNLPEGAACNQGNAWLCASNVCENFQCRAPCLTSADCPGNAACTAGKCAQPIGAPCNSSGVCISGVCSDNVCCNISCLACNACSAELKQDGSNSGVCGPATAGQPHDSCSPPYKCDGAGKCCDANGMNCN